MFRELTTRLQRVSHAFTSVKLSQLTYGSSNYASQVKSGVTLATILGISLSELSAFQKTERRCAAGSKIGTK